MESDDFGQEPAGKNGILKGSGLGETWVLSHWLLLVLLEPNLWNSHAAFAMELFLFGRFSFHTLPGKQGGVEKTPSSVEVKTWKS